MQNFPNIKRFKLRFSKTIKKERHISYIIPDNYKKRIKPYNDLPFLVSNSSNNIPNNNNSSKVNIIKTIFSEKRKKIMNKNFKNRIKIIKYSTEKLQAKKEFNNKSKNKKLFSTIKDGFKNRSNIIHNKPKNLNKFIEEINSYLLPNDETFEYLQNLINKKIAINIETSKNDIIYQSLMSKSIPVNTYNKRLIFKHAIKNTFKEALKKAMLNKTLFNKTDIKEEYQKQINNIKKYLNQNVREKKDFTNKHNSELLNIHKYYIPLITNIKHNKLDLNKKFIKIIKLEKHKRNRKIIQNNSSDNIIFNQERFKKELFGIKIIKFEHKKKEPDKNNTLPSLPTNNFEYLHKESSETNIPKVIMKKKIKNINENRLKNITQKQKISIDDHINLKSFIKKSEGYLTKIEDSVQKDINAFYILSNNKNINKNKNEDIINYINDKERSVIIENSLAEEKIEKSLLRRTLFEKEIDIRKILFNDVGRYEKQQNNN